MYSLYKGAHIKVVEGPVQVITLPHPPGLCAVLLPTLLPHSLLPQVTHSEIIIIIHTSQLEHNLLGGGSAWIPSGVPTHIYICLAIVKCILCQYSLLFLNLPRDQSSGEVILLSPPTLTQEGLTGQIVLGSNHS